MKAMKTLNIKEMEMVNGGEALETCDPIDAIEELGDVEGLEEIEEYESCDPCESIAAGRRVRVKRYKRITIKGEVRLVPYYTWKTV